VGTPWLRASKASVRQSCGLFARVTPMGVTYGFNSAVYSPPKTSLLASVK